MPDKEFSQEALRIAELMGDFDIAAWKRITASDDGTFPAFLKTLDDVYPKSAGEIAVWNELTSPGNREALREFVACHGNNVNDYAKKLNAALLADSDRRAAKKAGGAGEKTRTDPNGI